MRSCEHGGRVLSYVRGKKAGEQRLVAEPLLIGGHINDEDEGLFTVDREAYHAAVQREVTEELHVGTKYRDRVVALLNDDSNEVGQVHLGVVHVFELESDDVKKRESMITGLEFLDRDQLQARRDSMETWSQICVDNLDRLLGTP